MDVQKRLNDIPKPKNKSQWRDIGLMWLVVVVDNIIIGII
jgi:hypothetical protein